MNEFDSLQQPDERPFVPSTASDSTEETVEASRICTKCETPIILRKVVLGSAVGAIEIPLCEHQATQLATRYTSQRVRNKEKRKRQRKAR